MGIQNTPHTIATLMDDELTNITGGDGAVDICGSDTSSTQCQVIWTVNNFLANHA